MSRDIYEHRHTFEESGPFPEKSFEQKRKEFNNSEFKVIPVMSNEQLHKTFNSKIKNHGKNI